MAKHGRTIENLNASEKSQVENFSRMSGLRRYLFSRPLSSKKKSNPFVRIEIRDGVMMYVFGFDTDEPKNTGDFAVILASGLLAGFFSSKESGIVRDNVVDEDGNTKLLNRWAVPVKNFPPPFKFGPPKSIEGTAASEAPTNKPTLPEAGAEVAANVRESVVIRLFGGRSENRGRASLRASAPGKATVTSLRGWGEDSDSLVGEALAVGEVEGVDELRLTREDRRESRERDE
ncbi:hypothetical protein HOG48_06710 [Candidatus Peregrinibacteria bacterium]|nr:hypothetical protein [Candidatus Peregrinibacteria bacterium]